LGKGFSPALIDWADNASKVIARNIKIIGAFFIAGVRFIG
jgi:hypothetical protein